MAFWFKSDHDICSFIGMYSELFSLLVTILNTTTPEAAFDIISLNDSERTQTETQCLRNTASTNIYFSYSLFDSLSFI